MSRSQSEKDAHPLNTKVSNQKADQRDSNASLVSEALATTCLQALLKSLPYSIAAIDTQGNFLLVNTLFQTFIQKEVGKIIIPGMSIYEAFADAPTNLHKAQVLLQRACGGESATITDTIFFNENAQTSYEIIYGPLMNEEHVCIGMTVFFKELNPVSPLDLTLPSLQALLNQQVSERTSTLEENNQTLQREILERRRVENALRQSEQNFRLLSEILPQLIWVINSDGTPNYFNHKSREFFGFLEHSSTIDWQKIIHSDDWPRLMTLTTVARETGKSFEGEVRMKRHSDNRYRWQMLHVVPIQDTDGQILKWIASVTDIDDLKSTEETLRRSEQQLRLITDAIPYIIWELNADGRTIEYSNQRWLDYCGLTREQISLHQIIEFVHPDDVQQITGQWQHAMKEGIRFEGECRIRRASDDLFRWHLTRCEPIRDSNGTIFKWLSTSTDIHDNKLAEEKLRQSEQDFRLLADMLPQIVWTARPDGQLDYNNQKWSEYTGMTQEQTKGWRQMLHPDDIQPCIDTWAHSFMTGEPYEIEYRFKRASDGMFRWHLGRALPVRDTQGQIVKWFGTGTDIHDWKTAQEQMAQLLQNEQTLRAEAEATNERLEEMNKVQSDFISIVSHEFRTTLTGIQGFSELLCVEEFSTEEVKDYASDINTDARRLTRMINDLLDLERMKSGKMALEIEAVDLNRILEEVVERATLTASKHTLLLHQDVRLPLLQGDSDKLIQVLTNLLSNAIKYAPNGGEIVLTSKRQKNKIHITVQDHGIGIPAHALEEVFAPYSRIDVQRTRYIKGTGLGLAIVRQIVEMHNGHVWVESVLGSGSTFHLLLPLISPPHQNKA